MALSLQSLLSLRSLLLLLRIPRTRTGRRRAEQQPGTAATTELGFRTNFLSRRPTQLQ